MSRNISLFSWYGGKFMLLKWLLPNLFPKKRKFLDLFGGSASVLINRQIANPCKCPIYNDINGDVVKFFRVLRDHGDCVKEMLRLTPYSREEFIFCSNIKYEDNIDDIEWARRFFVVARMAMFFGGDLNDIYTPRFDRSNNNGNKASGFCSSVENMEDIIPILRKTQIECMDGIELLKQFKNVEDILIYADPPYPGKFIKRGYSHYAHDSTDDLHEDLYLTLSEVKGLAAVSTVQNSMYDEFFSSWRKRTRKKAINSASLTPNGTSKYMDECLFMNYDELGNKIA